MVWIAASVRATESYGEALGYLVEHMITQRASLCNRSGYWNFVGAHLVLTDAFSRDVIPASNFVSEKKRSCRAAVLSHTNDLDHSHVLMGVSSLTQDFLLVRYWYHRDCALCPLRLSLSSQ